MLILHGDPGVDGDGITREGMHLYLFYCLFFLEERSMDFLEEQLETERNPDLEFNEDVRLGKIGESTGRKLCRRT